MLVDVQARFSYKYCDLFLRVRILGVLHKFSAITIPHSSQTTNVHIVQEIFITRNSTLFFRIEKVERRKNTYSFILASPPNAPRYAHPPSTHPTTHPPVMPLCLWIKDQKDRGENQSECTSLKCLSTEISFQHRSRDITPKIDSIVCCHMSPVG